MTPDPSFAPPVARQFETYDTSDWKEAWLVGDVHGCRDALERLLDSLDPGSDELVVFVGDLVRKGPDSSGVCRLVRERENLVSVRGNNEQKLLDGRAACPSLTAADERFLTSLPLVIGIDETVVLHGGIDHRKPLTAHDPDELLTLRSLDGNGTYDRPYWFEERSAGRRVAFGHTVLSEPFHSPWAVGLDTGCVYGGQLTAYRVSTGEFVAVESGRTYQSRSADCIVDPRPPASSEA